VSGDFLDFYDLVDNRFGVAIGDVSGHGVETAIVMGMAKMAFRIRSSAMGSVKDLMSYANQDLFTELRRSAFITGIFAVIDRDTYQMTYVRAGHPKPLLRRAKGGDCGELEGNGCPSAWTRGRASPQGLEERAVDLAPGDVILLYTDGVIEAGRPRAVRDRAGEAGADVAPADGSARAILDHVTAALDAFVAKAVMGDDVTLICLKIK
jgi:sigma-B regulation protein RsbU (phosphoserine phosphatase)